jgi:hypothetical protein
MKSKLRAPGTKRLKLKYAVLLSSFALNVNLRRYTEDMLHVNHNDPSTIHLNSMSNTEKDYHHELHRQHLHHQAMIKACYDKMGHVDQAGAYTRSLFGSI